MTFTTWSIRNPIPAIVLFVVLTVAGFWGFGSLSVQNMPDLDFPMVNVTLVQPGAAPPQLETEVARKVEDSLATVSGVKHLRTSVVDGQVAIAVQFVMEKNLSDALIETKDAVDRVRFDLPVDLQPPTIGAQTSAPEAMLVYTVSSPRRDEETLSWFVDDVVAKAVLGLAGVGRFERVGGVQRELRIEVDPTKLAALGLTAGDVSRALRLTHQDFSGGRGQLGGAEQAIRTISTVKQASELEALPIALTGGRQIRLDQVATVRDGVAERTQAARLDGAPVIGFKIYRAKGFDEGRIAAGVKTALDRLSAADPSLNFTQLSGSVAYTAEQYRGSMNMLYEGALLAILVVWLFLRDGRATLIAASALPLSILSTFAAMAWLGYSLNTITLLALAVVVGILVDDAIVEIENIERHRAMGKSARQAATDAVVEIGLAVVATTLSLVVVFLPTALMSGISGLLFKQFGWTAVIAVLASMLVARLLTPMMAAYLLAPPKRRASGDGAVMRAYLAAVRWCLGHRRATVAAAVLSVLGSLALAPLIPAGLIPPADRGYTTMSVELPPGASLASTLDTLEAARAAIANVPGVRSIFASVGEAQQSGPGEKLAGEVRRGALILTLAPREKRDAQVIIENLVREKLRAVPGARFALAGSAPGEKIQLILSGDNAAALKDSARALERQMRGIPGLSNVRSTASLERPEITVRPDPVAAAERGVSAAAIGELARIATSGDFDAQVARINFDNRQVFVRVRVADSARRDLETLAGMRLAGRDGPIPLSSVADLSIESGPAQIDRYDRRRYVSVEADLGGAALGDALAAAKNLPAVRDLPSSTKLIETGDAEIQAELASGFGAAILAGVLCVFCVLVLLFKDAFQPLTILSAIPLSLGGAFLALLVARSEMGLPALIGLVMLIGVVTKNSILVVEYAIVSLRGGMIMTEALVDACHKRARPIVMTTVAMVAGMAPVALGFGADASFRQPMAIAVIGGLLASTALSLLVVPVVFTYVAAFEKKVLKLFSALNRPTQDRPAPAAPPHPL